MKYRKKSKKLSSNRRKMVEMVMDISPSMNGMKLQAAKSGAMEYLNEDNFSEGDWVGIREFHENNHTVHPLTEIRDIKKNLEAVRDIIRKKISIGGIATALWDALGSSVDILAKHRTDEYELVVVAVTDGMDNSSRRFRTPESLLNYARKKNVDIRFLFIAIGKGVDVPTLERVGEVVHVDEDASAIQGAFGQVGTAIGTGMPLQPSAQGPGVKEENEKKGGKDMEKECKCSDMEFQTPRRKKWVGKRMEEKAEKACEMLGNYYDPMSGGSTAIPVHLLKPEKFEELFGKSTDTSEWCREFYNTVRIPCHRRGVFEDDVYMDYVRTVVQQHFPTPASRKPIRKSKPISRKWEPVHEDMPPEISVENCCIRPGELVLVCIFDMDFPEWKEKLDEHLPAGRVPAEYLAPGIFIKNKGLTRDSLLSRSELPFIEAFAAARSLIYYSISRKAAVEMKNAHTFLNVVSSTVALLTLDDRELDILLKTNRFGGDWAIPINIAAHVLARRHGLREVRDFLSDMLDNMDVGLLMEGELEDDSAMRTWIDWVRHNLP